MALIEAAENYQPTPEEEAVWNSEEEPDFDAIRASIPDEETSSDGTELGTGEIDNTEEQTNDTEQSEVTDSDIDETEETTDETEETEEVNPDEEDQTDEDSTEETEEETVTVQTHKFKAHGQDFEFDEKEMMEMFPKVFGQAMDYTKKMQQIAPYRKAISAMDEAGLAADDLNKAIDVLKGDKNAIAALVKEHGIDLGDLDIEDVAYTPNQYGKDDAQLDIEEVVNTISADPEFRITKNVVESQWDDTSKEFMAANPQAIAGLHNDIKSGLFDKVAPRAMKLKIMNENLSDIQAYVQAGKAVLAEQEALDNEATEVAETVKEVTTANDRQKSIKSKAKSRKAGAITNNIAGSKSVNYLDASDEDFEDWYKKTMDGQ